MRDPIEQIADARDGFDRVAQVFESVQASRQPATATHPNKQVTVSVDPDGVLLDVVIGTHWSLELDGDELAAAILETYAAAGQQRLEAWGTSVAEAMDQPAPPARPMPPTHESLSSRLEDLVSEDSFRENSDASLEALASLLQAAVDDVDQVTRAVEDQARASHEGVARGATVTVSGGGVLHHISLDPAWAQATVATSLSQYVMKAYRAALAQTQGSTAHDIVANSNLGTIQRLANDPRALAEHLRLL
ncbi:hypothetical protein GCM10027020_13740 [Nocardioides salsibiostraticola]